MRRYIFSLVLVLLFIFCTVSSAAAINAKNSELLYQWNHAVYNSKTNDETILVEYKQPMAVHSDGNICNDFSGLAFSGESLAFTDFRWSQFRGSKLNKVLPKIECKCS